MLWYNQNMAIPEWLQKDIEKKDKFKKAARFLPKTQPDSAGHEVVEVGQVEGRERTRTKEVGGIQTKVTSRNRARVVRVGDNLHMIPDRSGGKLQVDEVMKLLDTDNQNQLKRVLKTRRGPINNIA
jgi:hypothetical protein